MGAGVVLYWLLTDWLPFGSREVGGLYQRILVDPERVEPMGQVAPWDAEEVEKRRQVGKPRRGGLAEARPAPPLEASPGGQDVPGVRSPGGRWLSWRAVLGALLVATVCVALALPPGAWRGETVLGQARLAREVASSGQVSQAARGAAPLVASTPAPVVKRTTAHKEDTRVKTAKNMPPKRKAKSALRTLVATGAACTVLAGCTTAAPQVRRVPPPQPCPLGAVEAMRDLGLAESIEKYRRKRLPGGFVRFPGKEHQAQAVQEGPVTIRVPEDFGGLPQGTVLSGQLYIGPERVYGRFTQAQVPSGTVYPVCLELMDDDERGVEIDKEASSDSVIKIGNPNQNVRPVERFP